MLTKALITSVVAIMALLNTGNRPAAAIGVCPDCPQDMRPTPSVVGSAPSIDYAAEGDEFREEFHQTYPLSGTGRVSLENINGSVQIKVWDRAAVQVDAVKRASRKERLAETKIDVNASEESIRIRTEYPDWNQNSRYDRNDNPASIDYTLTVPRKVALESIELINGALDIDGVEGNVKGSSINGRVTARGLMGETKLSTINGSLQANFTQLDQVKGIYLQSVNGNLTLVIPSDANCKVRASTVHGGISNDFGLQVRDGEYVGHDLDGQIGSGGPRINLGNVNGAIRITHAQDGRTISPATSLLAEKEGDETRVVIGPNVDIAIEKEAKEINQVAREAAKAAQKDADKVAKEANKAAKESKDQRQVDAALREAQREVERAQAEIQKEVQRQANEQVREQARAQAREVREQARAAVGEGRGRGIGVAVGAGGSRFTTQETKTFTIDGTPRVNVSTFDGHIAVHGWDKSEVMYTATKRADDEEQLKQINIRTEQQGPSVSIIATADDQNGSAALDVYVPRRTSLHVSSDDGRLNLEGVSGDLTMRTGDGSIEVSNGGGQLQVNTGDGRIHVANFDGQVDARTGDGSISLDGNLNAVTARTGDGSITLSVPPGSNFTVETNADDAVSNEGLTLTEDISPSQRVKRWRVGSGGKVFVLNTGDGKIILRSR